MVLVLGRLAAVMVALVGVAACGSGTVGSARTEKGPSTTVLRSSVVPTHSSGPAGANLVDEGYRGRFRGVGMVLESPEHGPELCLGAAAASLPPQCTGPTLPGWSWTELTPEDVAGTRWGSYVVVGHYDGTTFTLTEPAKPAGGTSAAPEPAVDYRTPCPTPPGGWRAVNPTTATDAAFNAALTLAQRQSGYGLAWMDQNLPPGARPALPNSPPPAGEARNDSARIVLNLTTTGSPAAMERVIRTVWGGALCVSRAIRSDAELRHVQDALNHTPGLLMSGPNGMTGQVDLTVVRATVQQQHEFDARFGPGVVHLTGRLQPID
jgi:hypothetical protein